MLATTGNGAPRTRLSHAELLSLVHPDLHDATARILPLLAALPELNETSLAAFRKMQNPSTPEFVKELNTTRHQIAASTNGGTLSIWTMNANAGLRRPCILYLHGGGFISGSAEKDLPFVQDMALALDACVVAPEYRLAPEHPFPACLDDAFGTLVWMTENAQALGIDASKIVLVGRSAGGGLAAMLADKCRAESSSLIAFQVLLYPMLDDETGSKCPVPEHQNRFLWNAQQNKFAWAALRGHQTAADWKSKISIPARLQEFEGFPPTWIAIGALDLFVDENLAFTRSLCRAGIRNELQVLPGAWHGFDLIAPDAPLSKALTKSVIDAIQTALSSRST